MDKYPVTYEEKTAGEMIVDREGLYLWFDLHCPVTMEGIWCAWAVGEQGELRIGILEPQGRAMTIRRRFSDQLTHALGTILRGEIRRAGEKENWEILTDQNRKIRSLWLRERLRGQENIRCRSTDNRLVLLLPYRPEKPFLLTPMFCFARLRKIDGAVCWQIAFDAQEKPIFF